MLLTRLKLLCEQANRGEAELSEALIEEFGERCKAAIRKQFSPKDKEFRLRMSAIGKDVRQQQCEKLGLEKDEEEPYNSVLKFLIGDMTEAMLMVLMKAAGVKIEDEAKKVTLAIGGVELPGEYDLKINGKIYDVKSASPFAFENKFARGFDHVDQTDGFGYVSQLYMYAEADNAGVGGWLVMNKVTGELLLIEPPMADDKYRTKHLTHAAKNIKILQETTSLADIDKSIPTVDELWYGKPTGKKVLHPDYKYFSYKKALWGDRVQYKANAKSTAKVKTKNYYVV